MAIQPDQYESVQAGSICGYACFLAVLDDVIVSSKNLNRRMGLLLIDLSHVEMLTPVLGYGRVSSILNEVYEVLMDMKRPSDMLERIHENRFALIIPDIKFPAVVDLAVNKVHETLAGLREMTGLDTTIYPKTGVALFPEHGDTAEDLVLEADTAAQAAQFSASHVVHAGSSECLEINQNKMIEAGIEPAFLNSEFTMCYQPKVDLATGSLYGAEALIRWTHPELGVVNPEQFMKVIERGPMLQEITLWTLNTALHQSKALRELVPEFRTAVNLSPGLLDSPDLVDLVFRALKTWETDPGSLILEVTETAMLVNQDESINNLKQLNEAGITLSIDDFGTGYSSYSYLQQLPVQELKIDKSFIQNLMTDESSVKLVRSMIALGKDFDIKVLAEGVESDDIARQLVDMGCEYAQGYLIGRPMPVEEITAWIEAGGWSLPAGS